MLTTLRTTAHIEVIFATGAGCIGFVRLIILILIVLFMQFVPIATMLVVADNSPMA